MNLRYHDLFLRCDLTSLLIILILNCSALLVFDYCNNVLMIRANDARFLFCNLRCVQLHILTYTHTLLLITRNINETFKSAVKIRHAKNKGLKVNAWHERKLAENNWAFPRNKSELQYICKIYICAKSVFLTKLNEARNELHTLFITLCNDV